MSEQKRSVVILRSNPVCTRLAKTAESLSKNGLDITVLAWDRDKNGKAEYGKLSLPSGFVPIIKYHYKGSFSKGFRANFLGLIRFQFSVFKWLLKHRKSYDIIHAYDLDTGFIALKASKLLKKKLVYDIADYYAESHFKGQSSLSNLTRRLENRVINSASAVIICSEKRKEQIAGTRPKNLMVIHNTPMQAQLKGRKYDLPGERLKLVYVGILGNSRFIDGIINVVKKREDCEFHIGGFGGGMEEHLREVADECDRVRFYGRLEYSDTLALEMECDVMAAIYDPKIPNHTYAAPNKFYEALMLGKPLIMAENTGMDDIVSTYGIGEVIEFNEESLDKALDALIQKKSSFGEISIKCRELYKTLFSWEEMEKRLIGLYSLLSPGLINNKND